jgi:hypothetical protein
MGNVLSGSGVHDGGPQTTSRNAGIPAQGQLGENFAQLAGVHPARLAHDDGPVGDGVNEPV